MPEFYANAGEKLRAWVPPAPKSPEVAPPDDEGEEARDPLHVRRAVHSDIPGDI